MTKLGVAILGTHFAEIPYVSTLDEEFSMYEIEYPKYKDHNYNLVLYFKPAVLTSMDQDFTNQEKDASKVVNKMATFINKRHYIVGQALLFDKYNSLTDQDMHKIVTLGKINLSIDMEFDAPAGTTQEDRQQVLNDYCSHHLRNYIMSLEQLEQIRQQVHEDYVIKNDTVFIPYFTYTTGPSGTPIFIRLIRGTLNEEQFNMALKAIDNQAQKIQRGEVPIYQS